MTVGLGVNVVTGCALVSSGARCKWLCSSLSIVVGRATNKGSGRVVWLSFAVDVDSVLAFICTTLINGLGKSDVHKELCRSTQQGVKKSRSPSKGKANAVMTRALAYV